MTVQTTISGRLRVDERVSSKAKQHTGQLCVDERVRSNAEHSEASKTEANETNSAKTIVADTKTIIVGNMEPNSAKTDMCTEGHDTIL